MATVTKGRTFTSGETVTPAKLNDVVDLATVTFSAADDTDDSTLEVSGNKFQVKDAGITASKLQNPQYTGFRNAIINGNFAIKQRPVPGTVTLAAGAYGHDRWKAGSSGCTYTFATSNNITTLTISAGSLIQVIEGNNLFTGTYTLSWTGTAQGKIGAGSFAASGVTGSVTGGSNLNIEFNTGTLSLVQFEQGSVATPFERRPFGTELALCQRYYFREDTGLNGRVGGGNGAGGVFYFPVVMRAAPTIARISGGTGNDGIQNATITGLSSVDSTTTRASRLGFSHASTLNQGAGYTTTGFVLLEASSEL